MAGGTAEIHRDSDYLATGTHDGATSTTLRDVGSDLKSWGVRADLFIENETQSTSSVIATVNEVSEITTDDAISWDNGDTYKIYKTGTKNSLISTQWTDLSRGWKTDKDEMIKGWRSDDKDLDRKGEKVFGPGQPEK